VLVSRSGTLAAVTTTARLPKVSCYASGIEYRDGQDARPTRIIEKLTVKLDAQQLINESVAFSTLGA